LLLPWFRMLVSKGGAVTARLFGQFGTPPVIAGVPDATSTGCDQRQIHRDLDAREFSEQCDIHDASRGFAGFQAQPPCRPVFVLVFVGLSSKSNQTVQANQRARNALLLTIRDYRRIIIAIAASRWQLTGRQQLGFHVDGTRHKDGGI
jgi:hypothetical protein